MSKMIDWDSVQAWKSTISSSNNLVEGKYMCKVVDVVSSKDSRGNEQAGIYVDIVEGAFTNYFQRKLEADIEKAKLENRTPPMRKRASMLRFSLDENQLGKIKLFIEIIQNVNGVSILGNQRHAQALELLTRIKKSPKDLIFPVMFVTDYYNGIKYAKADKILTLDEFKDESIKPMSKAPTAQQRNNTVHSTVQNTQSEDISGIADI